MTDPNFTQLALVLDRSGSMNRIADDMNEGIKAFLEEQLKLPGTFVVDVTVFDSEVEFPYESAAVSDIKFPLIVPRGSTALLDAIGHAVGRLGEKLEALPEERRPSKVLVLVVTDGMENASKDWTRQDIKKVVTRQQEEFSWEFVFLGANIDSFSVGGGLGFSSAATMNYAPTAGGTSSMLRSMSAYVADTRSGLDASFTEADRQAADSE